MMSGLFVWGLTMAASILLIVSPVLFLAISDFTRNVIRYIKYKECHECGRRTDTYLGVCNSCEKKRALENIEEKDGVLHVGLNGMNWIEEQPEFQPSKWDYTGAVEGIYKGKQVVFD